MSFTNNVYGGVPQSELVFSTSNVSSDNASFINLSVSGSATITNLTTVNWSQPNLNASTIVTDTLVVTNTSAVNLDVSGVMNVSDLNISDLNVSDISVSTLNVGDIVIDEAEVTTLRFDDVTNANYSEIQRDNDTLKIAGGYVNGTGTQFNGDIAFTPYNLSNFTPPSMVVQASDGKVYIPNMSALDINTSSLHAIDITASTTIVAPTMNTSTLNASTINVDTDIDVPDINTSQINTSNISVDVNLTVAGTTQTDTLEAGSMTADCDMTSTLKTSSNMYYPNNLLVDFSAAQTATTIELSSNLSLNGIDLLPDLVTAADPTLSMLSGTAQITNANISTLTCDLTPNLAAGVGITVTSVGGIATITNTGIVTDPLNLSTLNASQINASDVHTEALNVSGSAAFLADGLTVFGQTTTQNISTANISSTAFITASGEISAGGGLKATGGSGVYSTGVFHLNNQASGLGDSLEIYYTGTQFGMGTVSGKDFTINAGINTGGLVIDGTLNNVNMSNCSITNLSLDNLTYDLTPNLTAGTGITITSVGGKPTITATGGGGAVPDPLNLSQLNASNISVDGDIELIGTSNISANATTATVFKVVAENISVSNDITCSNLTRTATLESVGNTSVGFDLSVGNDATITRDLQVQRFLDAGRPTFIMLRRTANTAMSGTAFNAIFNSNTSGQVNGEFTTASGVSVIVATGGWYRVSWGLGFKRTSNTGGDRAAVRAYVRTRPQGGSYSFNSAKNVIGSSCYMRRSNQCREGHVSGYNLVYISAGGAVSLRIEAMVEGNASWNSSLTGIDLRGSSNLMVEFVSSAAET